MRTTDTLTISLPPAMSKQLEKVRKAENRTTSELLREALRQYIETRYPTEVPTKQELLDIRRGRAAFTRGEHVSLTDLTNELESKNHKTRTKAARKASK